MSTNSKGNLHLPPFDAGFGVYVHWPFCLAKCPYCDFNSHVRHGGTDDAPYLEAYKRELRHMAALAPASEVQSIFFGGGTPSLMKPETVAGILDEIARLWSVSPNAEITLEANPTSVEATRFAGYRAAGVNRVSLGVQSLDAADLAYLGRKHTVEEALAAVAVAAKHFERFSFDLIYARPGLEVARWREELLRALSHAPTHLSLYQLTIEPGTMFQQLHAAGKIVLPDEDLSRALYDVTQEICAAHGLPAYEVSNHARLGEESRHNLLYWRYGEYAGVGPGAHSRLYTERGRRALSTERLPEKWRDRVLRDGHAIVTDETLTGENEADEFLLMGLRLIEGIDPARYAMLSGRALDVTRIDTLKAEGLVEFTPRGHLRASAKGFPVLDGIVAELAS
jgi:putative oxygen-independent coproporphyrinogen III oxidase